MDLTPLLRMTVAAMAIATATVTIGKTELFARLRRSLDRRSPRLGRLAGCPYCLSHWCAIATVFWDPPCTAVVDNVIAAFALVALTSIFGVVLVTYLRTLEAMS